MIIAICGHVQPLTARVDGRAVTASSRVTHDDVVLIFLRMSDSLEEKTRPPI